jgi:hypothetical protein
MVHDVLLKSNAIDMYNANKQLLLANVIDTELAIFGPYKPESDENWHFALFPHKRKIVSSQSVILRRYRGNEVKSILIISCSLLIVFTLCGCSRIVESDEKPLNDEPQVPPSSESIEPPREECAPNDSSGKSATFDFAEFPEEDYPRGMWTINQLVDKYGPYEELTSYFVDAHLVVNVRIVFKEIEIIFLHKDAACFSFYIDYLEAGYYEMSSKDKDIELEVHALYTSDSKCELPYGIKIGQSAKDDILNVYPKDSAFVIWSVSDGYSFDMIVYNYIFIQEDGSKPERYGERTGCVEYHFDEKEVLNKVVISWWPGF